MSLVSVVMAAHDAEPFISAAIRSALDQRGTDVELLVVDDRSSDGTYALVQRFAREDSRVRLLVNEGPKGPSAARNTALRHARGDWIALLDADDRFEPNRLEILLAEAAARGADLIADNLELIDFDTGARLGPALDPSWMRSPEAMTLDLLLTRDWPGLHAGRGFGFIKPLIRAGFLAAQQLAYDEDILAGEDLLLYARALDAGARLHVLSERLYLYSVRSGSLSSGWEATRELLKVNRRIAELPSAATLRLDLNARREAFVYQQFSQKLKRRQWGTLLDDVGPQSAKPILAALLRAAGRRLTGGRDQVLR